MKKLFFGVCVCMAAVLLSAVLTACGDSGDGTAADTTDMADTSAPTVTFLAAIEDARPLSMIALPGTHDSGATKDMILSGTAKCQSLSIAEQLAIGVRYFDIRLKRENGALLVYHGDVNQQLTFDEVLAAYYDFLGAHPSETVIVCIKEETDPEGDNQAFDRMVKQKLSEKSNCWFTENRIPTLGEVRGKCVLWRRYTTSGRYGFNASNGFSDNTTFTLTSGAYRLAVQDYYDNESADKKWEAVTSFFKTMQKPSADTYYLNNTSGYQAGMFGIPNIHAISGVVNPRLLDYLADAEAMVGIIATDFMTKELAEGIIQLNFR